MRRIGCCASLAIPEGDHMVVSKKERLKKELDSAIADGDLDLALAVAVDMVELEPDDAESHTSRSVILSKLGRIEESIKEIDEALSIDDNAPKVWYSKGCILMDNDRSRPALACFYKSLDLDPSQERVRTRFTRCLDKMISEMEETVQEIYQEGPALFKEDPSVKPVFKADFTDHVEDEETSDKEPLPEEEPDLPPRRRGGSLLDDDLFDDDDGGDESEDWGDDEDIDEVESWGDDEDGPVGSIQCRCGEEIPIYSEERPYRFECPDCGRMGTLK